MRVYGGMTNAGNRIVRPQREAWICPDCGVDVARYYPVCPECRAPYTPISKDI